jgi:hypothetical protein
MKKDMKKELNAPFVVRDWAKTREGHQTRVSALVDGHDMFFRSDLLHDSPERADGFLAVSLIPAMYMARPLDLSSMPPVSAGLLEQVDKIQNLWVCWNEYLTKIPVITREEATPPGKGNLTFFSGGVDAVHTAMSLGDQVGRMLLLNGFDFEMGEAEFAAAAARTRKLADLLGHELHTLDTNWIVHTRRERIARNTSLGAALAGMAHMIQPAQANIAATFSWPLMFPFATHPCLDPLWSSPGVKINHHGNDYSRLEKIAEIAKRPELLRDLWVCHEDPVKNCGKCKKCQRTIAMFKMADVDPLPFPQTSGGEVEKWLANVTEESDFLRETTCYAIASENQKLIDITRKGERAVLRRTLVRRLMRKLFPERATKGDKSMDLRPWGFGPRPEL